jgi:hypothetical protein
MPADWDAGNITVTFYWKHKAASAFAVRWSASCLARGNDDAIDTAFGTAVDFTDTGGTTDDLYFATVGITPGGSPVAGDWVFFQVARIGGDGADTLDVEAQLMAVELTWGVV